MNEYQFIKGLDKTFNEILSKIRKSKSNQADKLSEVDAEIEHISNQINVQTHNYNTAIMGGKSSEAYNIQNNIQILHKDLQGITNQKNSMQDMYKELDQVVADMKESLLEISTRRNEVINSFAPRAQLSESQMIIDSMIEGMNKQR